MPYYLEKKNNKFKLKLRDNPEHNFSNKYMTKQQAIKQMQAIEISKQRNARKTASFSSGSGFFDVVRKIKDSVKNITNKVQQIPTGIISSAIPTIERYTSKVEGILKRYGDFGIKNITLRKEPVDSKVMAAAHILTQNEIKDLMNKNNVNTLYHLSMVCEIVDSVGKSIFVLVEKNENINLEIISDVGSGGGAQMKFMQVSIPTGFKPTINSLLTKTRLTVGNKKFYTYDAVNSNCGIFLIDILQANGLYKELYKDFLYQVPYYNNNISETSRNKLNILTKLGSLFSHLRSKVKGGGIIRFI
jgi:hypothetical protein